MRIAFLCKRQYMGKDVIVDRYARLYEIPWQLARLGHEVRAFCLSYQGHEEGSWEHEAEPGRLIWESASLGRLRLPALAAYPWQVLRRLRSFAPDIVIGASDIPQVALAAWLARRLERPLAVDLYDNFEGFGQARVPGTKRALRRAVRRADLVTTTSEPLSGLVRDRYKARGQVLSMPSTVDLEVFGPGDREAARHELGLPVGVPLVGTAGGLYRDKGVQPLYAAWEKLRRENPDVQLVLAGPHQADLPPPGDDRVHLLGHMGHERVATLFQALDVGVISILDTPFGRYCFPQKAYEMLACDLPVVVADVGAMHDLFSTVPQCLFPAADSDGLAKALGRQLAAPVKADVAIEDWRSIIARMEAALKQVACA